MTNIKRRHLIYALKNSVWIFVIGLPLFAFLAYIQGEGVTGFLFGMVPITIITIVVFSYSLWQTQKKRAD